MTSRDFFGRVGAIIRGHYEISLYSEEHTLLYQREHWFDDDEVPHLKEVLDKGIKEYREEWLYQGEPAIAEIYTIHNWNLCVIDIITKEKRFNPEGYVSLY